MEFNFRAVRRITHDYLTLPINANRLQSGPLGALENIREVRTEIGNTVDAGAEIILVIQVAQFVIAVDKKVNDSLTG